MGAPARPWLSRSLAREWARTDMRDLHHACLVYQHRALVVQCATAPAALSGRYTAQAAAMVQPLEKKPQTHIRRPLHATADNGFQACER